MTNLLIKLFVKDKDNTTNAIVRRSFGRLGSVVGIVVNLLLFGGKLFVGLLIASVSIVADAVNNLSDSGSQLIALFSSNISSKPADKEHPFGHQRVEYVASLIVAFIIFFLAFQLVVSSWEKIVNPTPIVLDFLTIIVLVVAIFTKIWLCLFNRKLGKKINSTVMMATSVDSLSDVLATSAVLLSAIINFFFPSIMLDGYMGIAVAIFIVISGIKILKDTMGGLIGNAPSTELVKEIEDKILSYPNVMGLHDLVVHSYGPSKCFATVHLEVDEQLDFIHGHDLSDNIERAFADELGINLVIHLDPINISDEFTVTMRAKIKDFADELGIKMHDFRVVKGNTHSNLLFDLDVPYDFKLTDEQLIKHFAREVASLGSYYVVINVDHNCN